MNGANPSTRKFSSDDILNTIFFLPRNVDRDGPHFCLRHFHVFSFDITIMSHYYHVYPGASGAAGSARPGPDGHIEQPPPYSPPRRYNTPTPPPPGVSPYPPTTPEGVLTQVQTSRHREPLHEIRMRVNDEVHEDFDESRNVVMSIRGMDSDLEPSQYSQTSDLTHLFPRVQVQRQDQQQQHHREGERDARIPDFLSKVLRHTVTASDEYVIERFDHDEQYISSVPQASGSDVGSIHQYQVQVPRRTDFSGEHSSTFQPPQRFQHPYRIPMDSDDSWKRPQDSAMVGGDRGRPRRVNSVLSGVSEPAFHSTPKRIQSPMSKSAPARSSSSRSDDSRDRAAFLHEERIHRMLGSLSPLPPPSSRPSIPPSTSEGISTPPTPPPSDFNMSFDSDFPSGATEKTLMPAECRRERESEPSPIAQEISEAVRQVRHAVVRMVGGEVEKTGLERHNFPMISRASLDLDEEPEGVPPVQLFKITVPELVVPIEERHDVTFETHDIAKFLLVAKNSSTARWTIPSTQRFHDVMNTVENTMRRGRIAGRLALAWCSEWEGGIGLMGIKVTDMKFVENIRNVIAKIRIGGLWYNSYPKAALLQGSEMSLILRAELRKLDLEWIPYSLFEQNSKLSGSVCVKYSKDNQHDGVKDGERFLILEGDPQFFESIQSYPAHHPFKVGSSTVVFRSDADGGHNPQITREMSATSSSSVVSVAMSETNLRQPPGSTPTSQVHRSRTGSAVRLDQDQEHATRGRRGRARGNHRGKRGFMFKKRSLKSVH